MKNKDSISNEIKIVLVREEEEPHYINYVRIVYPDIIAKSTGVEEVDLVGAGIINFSTEESDFEQIDDNGIKKVKMTFLGELETVYE